MLKVSARMGRYTHWPDAPVVPSYGEFISEDNDRSILYGVLAYG